ncbi:unnamed protein product [Linum tenue]|uniref:CCHC-type domain-containing protein n=1 Tax=Linum tenue TaxID=586396 RepID=A0AAV0RZF9_9ROSI|nr:unnamed protein product [Linum tenue]
MVVWVQFPGFPVHFYHKEILFTLGNMIGRSIKLDYHTLHQERTKFARMAVEVDLSKPLVPRIRLDGRWQKVEFENLPVVCFECGKIGHTKVSCPSLYRKVDSPSLAFSGVAVSGNDEGEQSEVNGGFGPWMMVTRKSRRNPRESPNKGKFEEDSRISNGPLNHKVRKGEDQIMGGERDLPVLQDTQPQSQRGHGQGKQSEKPRRKVGGKRK